MADGVTRVNASPGKPPTSCWMAFPIDEDRSVIALVGLLAVVQSFVTSVTRRGRRAKYFKFDFADGHPGIAAFIAGVWPASVAPSVVRTIEAGHGRASAVWARNYLRVRHDPERMPLDGDLDAMARRLAEAYLYEVQRALYGAP